MMLMEMQVWLVVQRGAGVLFLKCQVKIVFDEMYMYVNGKVFKL